MEFDTLQHETPIWRDRADFILLADVTVSGDAPQFEQLWARRVGDNRFELCCIPFFAYGLALGDEVTSETGPGIEFAVREVVRMSGHSTFRIWFGDAPGHEDGHQHGGLQHRVLNELHVIGVGTEWSSHDLLAVDAPPELLSKLENYLKGLEQSEKVEYEIGVIR